MSNHLAYLVKSLQGDPLDGKISLWHAFGAVHKWRQLNFRDFWPPPPPCQHFGPIHSTKITQPPLLRQNLGNPLPPPLFWRHLWMAPNHNPYLRKPSRQIHAQRCFHTSPSQTLSALFLRCYLFFSQPYSPFFWRGPNGDCILGP